MSKLRRRYIFLTCMTASLMIAGCVTDQTAQQQSGPEPITLQADGTFPDPMQAHIAARKMVNPKDTSTKHPYTITEQQFAQEEEEAHEKAEQLAQQQTLQGQQLPPIEPGSATDVRLAQLEQQVSSLNHDFKQLQPSISEANAQALATVDALDKISQQQQTQQTPAMVQPEQIAPASGTPVTSAVTDVRIGEHPGKTRIVLDMNAPGTYSASIDNERKVLTVELPQSAWSAAAQESGRGFIKGYTVNPSANGGVSVEIQLKGPAKLLLNSALPPNDTYGNRIALDVAPL